MEEEKIDQLLEATKKLEEIQLITEQKLKDTKAYRENNFVLYKLLLVMLVVIGIVFSVTIISISFMISQVSNDYFDYEKSITREVITDTQELNSGENDTIVNNSYTEGSIEIGK